MAGPFCPSLAVGRRPPPPRRISLQINRSLFFLPLFASAFAIASAPVVLSPPLYAMCTPTMSLAQTLPLPLPLPLAPLPGDHRLVRHVHPHGLRVRVPHTLHPYPYPCPYPLPPSQVITALYVMCTPMVFVFLADARKKAYQDRIRASTPPAPENGIVFPKVRVCVWVRGRERERGGR